MNMTPHATNEEIAAEEKRMAVFWMKFAAVSVLILVFLFLLWGPLMRPWIQERQGLAKLRKAEFDNMIQAEQSAAELEAAEFRAKAIGIVGAMAQAYPEYRSSEFIGGFADALNEGTIKQTFYIPTTASIPVLPTMANPVPVLVPEMQKAADTPSQPSDDNDS